MVQGTTQFETLFEEESFREAETGPIFEAEEPVEEPRKLWKDFCVFYTTMTSYSSNDELESIKRACLLRKAALLEKTMQLAPEPSLDGLRPPINIPLTADKGTETVAHREDVTNPIQVVGQPAPASRIPEPLLDSAIFQEIVKTGKAINGKVKDDSDEDFHDSYHYFSR